MSIAKSSCLTLVVFLCAVLNGCSNVNRLYLDSVKLAFFNDGPALTLEQVQGSKADLLRIVHGERLPAYMALAYIEDEQFKWVSADHAILAMNNDKIVWTSGLATNLQYTDNLAANPLGLPRPFADTSWQYHLDIEDKAYGLPVTSNWYNGAPRQEEFFGQTLTIVPVTETLTLEIDEPYWSHETSWDNIYWIEQSSKQVIYTEQKVTPYSDNMIITYVSRIGRLLGPKESQ